MGAFSNIVKEEFSENPIDITKKGNTNGITKHITNGNTKRNTKSITNDITEDNYINAVESITSLKKLNEVASFKYSVKERDIIDEFIHNLPLSVQRKLTVSKLLRICLYYMIKNKSRGLSEALTEVLLKEIDL